MVREKVGVLDCKTCGRDRDTSPCEHGSKCTESHSGQKGYVCNCSEEFVGPECQFRKEDICGDIGNKCTRCLHCLNLFSEPLADS